MRKSTHRQFWLLVLSLVGCCCLACRDQSVTPATRGQNQEQLQIVSGSESHWVYFPSAEKRAEFVARVKAMGYKVTAKPENRDPDAKYRYGVKLKRTDSFQPEPTDDAATELSSLAEQLGGEYNGWEATVEKGT